jgi:hypothetical protein
VAPNVATHNVQMQRQDPGSILHFYKAMMAAQHAAVHRPGQLRGAFAQGLVAGWQRRLEGEHSVADQLRPARPPP